MPGEGPPGCLLRAWRRQLCKRAVIKSSMSLKYADEYSLGQKGMVYLGKFISLTVGGQLCTSETKQKQAGEAKPLSAQSRSLSPTLPCMKLIPGTGQHALLSPTQLTTAAQPLMMVWCPPSCQQFREQQGTPSLDLLPVILDGI